MAPATDARLRTRLVSLALFLLTMAFIAIRTGRDALYFQGDGLQQLPKAYIAIALLAVPQAALVLRMLRRFGGRATRLAAMAVMTFFVGGFYAIAEPGAGLPMTVFFVVVPLVFSVLFSMLWILGSELFEAETKAAVARAFSRFGAASITGGVAGAALARAIGPGIGPRSLLLVGAGILGAATVVVGITHRRFPLGVLTEPSPERRPADQPPSLLAQPNLGLLLGIAMAAALTATFIEFQFYLTAAMSDRDSRAMTMFFANVYLLLQTASLALQLLITPRLQHRLGLGGSLMVLPLALFGGAAVIAAAGTALTRAGLRIAEGGLKAGVHRSTWEQSFLLIPGMLRARAKVLVDGLGARLAEGLAAAALWVWLVLVPGEGGLQGASTTWIALSLCASTVLWLGLTAVLRRRIADQDTLDDGEPWRAPLPDS